MLTQAQRMAGLADDQVAQVLAIGQALQQGRIADAERGAIAALARAPRHPEILRLFGMVQVRRGRFEAAVDTLQQAAALRPEDPLVYNGLGGAYEGIRDNTRSREALRRACELGPELALCWFNYARRVFADGETEAAVPALQRVIELQPDHISARTMLANLLRADGKVVEAEAQFRRIAADHPARAGLAWWGLALLKPIPLNKDDIATMRRVLQGTEITGYDRVATGFALAMALEQQGDFSGAFTAMGDAHAYARRSEPYDATAFSKHIHGITQAFLPVPRGSAEAQGEEVIFIVSLPRSGSTLTEQILASHSQVEGGTELPDLPQVVMNESDRVRQAFPQWVRTHTPAQWQALGQKYLARTAQWRQRRPRFTDKAPGNWQYVGVILAMLPNARVVICRRDPLENCLACYRYIFTRHPYTHDFADLAAHWRDFDAAAEQWKRQYPDRVREQIYENLVADPEAQIRELLAFCDLPFEEACLNFHANERRVTTPSAAQVREPIRRDTARAYKYGALLDPLRSALGLPPFRS
ncbi:MAG: sulfotransferase [Rudaea sp.]